MTYRQLVLLPEAALDAPLDGYGSNLKVHHSSGEVIGRMFRPTGSDGDAFAQFTQAFQPPTRWGGHVAPKLGACAHSPLDESRSPARPRRALPFRRQRLSVARSHLLCRPTFSLIPSGMAVGTLLFPRLAGAMASGKGWVRVASVAEARCGGALDALP
jgi:hypothetical protein